jgi:TrmH family RNA methyltransferase
MVGRHSHGEPMLTSAQRRLFRSLHRKRDRQEQRLFLVEGPSCVRELLAAGWLVECVAATTEWTAPSSSGVIPLEVSATELASLSTMEAPNQVVAIARMPAESDPLPPRGLTLCLDGVQDPGNLGTILRTAAWFGVKQVVCSPGCADRFNPKVVQSAMGALFRVPVSVLPLDEYLRGLPPGIDIFGAFLEGASAYEQSLREPAVLILGNEARGISAELCLHIRRRISIPRFGSGESLNVAMAAAILCSEWRRSR